MERKLNLEELQEFAVEFAGKLKPQEGRATVIGLSGELGSGKTTFVQSVARSFGVQEHVTSPTFVIEKIYKLKDAPFSQLIHIDAYRLESGEELRTLEWDQISNDPQNVIFIEWIEKVRDVVPDNAKVLSFEYVDENTRIVRDTNHA